MNAELHAVQRSSANQGYIIWWLFDLFETPNHYLNYLIHYLMIIFHYLIQISDDYLILIWTLFNDYFSIFVDYLFLIIWTHRIILIIWSANHVFDNYLHYSWLFIDYLTLIICNYLTSIICNYLILIICNYFVLFNDYLIMIIFNYLNIIICNYLDLIICHYS